MISKKNPKYLLTLFLSIIWTVLAPIFAIKVVIGIKIKNAGIFIKPKLNGIFVFKKLPLIKKPKAPNNAIKKPIAAALPIALLMEYPKNFNSFFCNHYFFTKYLFIAT